MFKIIIPIWFFIMVIHSAFAQNGQIDHELRFDCQVHDDSKCNPFAVSNPFCPDYSIYKNNWRVSHGSPQLRAFSSSNPSRVAVLKAKNTTGTDPKGEGMFIDYEFKANHIYVIEIAVRIEDFNYVPDIKITAKAANGLAAKTNATNCDEGTLPTISSSNYQIIRDKVEIGHFGGSEIGVISKSDFSPTKKYSQFWIHSDADGSGNEAEFVVSYATITDVTGPTTTITDNSICCGQSGTGSSFDPGQITGTTPSGGTGSYTYQWKKKTTGTWSNISGANEKDYNPSTITTTTYYKRAVTSGAETSESNPVTITVGGQNAWANICCNQSYEFSTTPFLLHSVTTNITPPPGHTIIGYQWASPYFLTDDSNAINPNWDFASNQDPDFYEPSFIDKTTTYQRVTFTRTLGTEGYAFHYFTSNLLTITIRKLLLETTTFSNNTSICDPREIVIDGDIITQNSTVDITSGTKIRIEPNSKIWPNVSLDAGQFCGN